MKLGAECVPQVAHGRDADNIPDRKQTHSVHTSGGAVLSSVAVVFVCALLSFWLSNDLTESQQRELHHNTTANNTPLVTTRIEANVVEVSRKQREDVAVSKPDTIDQYTASAAASSATTKEGDKSSAQKKHKTSGDAEKTRTPTILTEEKLRKFFAHYPTKGHPFPPLPRNWTCNLSASHGLYYFKPPSGNPTYRHPDTGMEYKPSPQAFAFHKKLTPKSVCAKANFGPTVLRSCENWLNNQKMRIAAIDNAIIADCGIVYRSA